ncbi:hypothetical protein L195_g029289 [Trifolium pratense]|uniref:Uncharacterized protein n=1 Tax=Trifolium pratense TaxID=57577 RepID=A0A2K3L4F0_TRIPR|nr:hypothetical protein L195_g029289 [Trifolium pratense]
MLNCLFITSNGFDFDALKAAATCSASTTKLLKGWNLAQRPHTVSGAMRAETVTASGDAGRTCDCLRSDMGFCFAECYRGWAWYRT